MRYAERVSLDLEHCANSVYHRWRPWCLQSLSMYRPVAPAHLTFVQLLVPRCSYLHLHIEPVREYFASFAPSTVDELWFEANGLPLKW